MSRAPMCPVCRKERRRWEACIGGMDWFPPSSIGFCPTQFRWLCENLKTLELGRWPRDSESGEQVYFNTHSFKNAAFTGPAGYAAEVKMRLARCVNKKEDDGLIVLVVLCKGVEVEEIAKLRRSTTWDIERRINRVIIYCSGMEPRTHKDDKKTPITYEEWCDKGRDKGKPPRGYPRSTNPHVKML